MAVNQDTLYIKFSQNSEVTSPDVYFRDVASLECTNKDILNRLKATKLIHIPPGKSNRYVFSVLKAIEIIHEVYPNLDINNIGDADFIVTYEAHTKKSKTWEYTKIALVCFTTFFGAAFSIMAFNNDAGVNDIFGKIYEWVTGNVPKGFTILEFTYSLGLMIGILVFFNHIGGRKITVDPTPMEVEMRTYDDNINTTLIESYTRKETNVDVGETTTYGNTGP